LDNVFGVDPSEVHIHVQRIPLDDIPTSEDKISTWLMDKFCLKDQLLSNFYIQGHFPCQGTEGDLSTVKCLVNIVAIIVLTSICAFFTLFSSLACAYLATATYFNIRPLPIFGLVNL
jgi:lysocardiolipin and lysophospholipid acyltransferase